MISVQEAQDIIKKNSLLLAPVTLPLQQAVGLIVATDIIAPIDLPPFHQSAMDGYAFAFADYQPEKTLPIAGIVPAGFMESNSHAPGKAIRIFTGAPVPAGADTIVMQEKTSVANHHLLIEDREIEKGTNVRLKGSEIKQGSLAMQKGTFLSAGAIGFLTGLGITELEVYPTPTIAIIVTGNELQQPGKPLQPGQVYESNSSTLQAALHQLHIAPSQVYFAPDDIETLTTVLEKALQQAQLILLTGGVSVGDYDFVLEAARRCAIELLFHKVKQKPGKPLFFGKKQQQLIFGLPGNPSSVLTCFYEYVLVALEALSLHKNLIRKERLPLAAPYTKKAGLTHFLKGAVVDNKAMPLSAQDSFKLSSFSIASCLVLLEESATDYKEGDVVEVHILPG